MCSVMAEDAEEAAKKLNHKEFFGKVVSVTVAKPKKRGILYFYKSIIRKSGRKRRRKRKRSYETNIK